LCEATGGETRKGQWDMSYDKYIILAGRNNGRLYPRTEAGKRQAMMDGVDASHICPARQVSERQAEDWQDWQDYGCDIQRSNAGVFVKS
jgi:hypothetical protein